jgi:cytochrome b involved in lipid metabolism
MLLGFFGRTKPSTYEQQAVAKPVKSSPETLRKRQSGRFSVKEIAQHNKRDDCWFIIEDKVYDVTSFVDKHPGGDILLSHAGMEATDIFDAFHADATSKMLINYEIGTVTDLKVPQNIKEHRELRRKLKKENMYQSNKLFYVYKTLTNLSLVTISVLLLALYFDKSKDLNDKFNLLVMTASAIFMGLFWQQCGWLSHDFAHHQVFTDRKYNNYVVYFLGNVCQGFSLAWWKSKHNLHHAVPNVAGYDPDIDTMPFLAWSDKLLEGELEGLPHFLIKYQYIFYFPLLMAARLSWLIQSILYANSRAKERTTELATLGLHYLWVGTVCISFVGITQGLIFFAMSQAITGLLLATAFALNHNGMDIVDKDKQPDFSTLQIITGRDVLPGPLGVFHWYMGGLDMQVEHHLFPSVPRHNLRKVQELYIPIAKRNGIKYHMTTFWEGTKELFSKLYTVSSTV